MKKTSIFVLIIILIVSLCGCDERNENKTNETKPDETKTNENHRSDLTFDDLPIDNETDINSAMMDEYSLSELVSYFGDYSDQEQSVYQIEFNPETPFFEVVNDKFPISFCRFNNNSCYSIYKVKEGGFFYVLWLEVKDFGVVAIDTFYIEQLKKQTDFDVLQPGVSTYEDVYAIDSASELILVFSHGTYSYSLLDNGRILEIEYSSTDIRDRKDLVVAEINLGSLSATPVSNLASIYKKDLP